MKALNILEPKIYSGQLVSSILSTRNTIYNQQHDNSSSRWGWDFQRFGFRRWDLCWNWQNLLAPNSRRHILPVCSFVFFLFYFSFYVYLCGSASKLQRFQKQNRFQGDWTDVSNSTCMYGTCHMCSRHVEDDFWPTIRYITPSQKRGLQSLFRPAVFVATKVLDT